MIVHLYSFYASCKEGDLKYMYYLLLIYIFLQKAPKQQNGTLCYQCDGKLQSESCQKVTFCGHDEVV